jgi:hypothetical protein
LPGTAAGMSCYEHWSSRSPPGRPHGVDGGLEADGIDWVPAVIGEALEYGPKDLGDDDSATIIGEMWGCR